MEGGTDALAKAVEVAPPAEIERQPYDERDIAVIRALQGDMPIVVRAVRARRRAARDDAGASCSRISSRCRSAGCCAAWRRSCSTAAPGSAPTAWASGRCPTSAIMELGPRMAAFRGISHCYQRPTYEDWPYSVFTMAHGRSKDECDAILDSIAESTGIDERATLYSSTEFKKIRLLYFTDGLPGLGTQARRRVSRSDRPRTRRAPVAAPGRRQLAGPRDALDRPRPDLHRVGQRRADHATSTATSTSTGSARGDR